MFLCLGKYFEVTLVHIPSTLVQIFFLVLLFLDRNISKMTRSIILRSREGF